MSEKKDALVTAIDKYMNCKMGKFWQDALDLFLFITVWIIFCFLVLYKAEVFIL